MTRIRPSIWPRATLGVIALVLVLAAGAFAPAARAERGYVYDSELSWWAVNSLEVASQYTGAEAKRIPYRTYVRCYTSVEAFEQPLLTQGASRAEAKTIVAYFAGEGSINLRAGTCARVRQFVAKRPLITANTATAMATMLHETLHRQGMHNERITECFANEAVKYAGWLARWNSLAKMDDATWLASERYGTRARDLAFARSAQWVASEYLMPKAECLRLTRSFSWAEYRRPS